MCSTGVNCQMIEYDDSACTDVCKCCVGIHNQGKNGKCRSACRKCRNFGTTWDPRRPMKPLPFEYIYNDTPGYSTTGTFVREGFSEFGAYFDLKCIAKNSIYGVLITMVLFWAAKRPMDMRTILIVSLAAAVLKCVLVKM